MLDEGPTIPEPRGQTEELDAFDTPFRAPAATVPDPEPPAAPAPVPATPPAWLVKLAGYIREGGQNAEQIAGYVHTTADAALEHSAEHKAARPLLAIGGVAGFQVGLAMAFAAFLLGGLFDSADASEPAAVSSKTAPVRVEAPPSPTPPAIVAAAVVEVAPAAAQAPAPARPEVAPLPTDAAQALTDEEGASDQVADGEAAEPAPTTRAERRRARRQARRRAERRRARRQARAERRRARAQRGRGRGRGRARGRGR